MADAWHEEVDVRALDNLCHEGYRSRRPRSSPTSRVSRTRALLGDTTFIDRSPIRLLMLEFNRATEQMSPWDRCHRSSSSYRSLAPLLRDRR